jgi:hypothetical protein
MVCAASAAAAAAFAVQVQQPSAVRPLLCACSACLVNVCEYISRAH